MRYYELLSKAVKESDWSYSVILRRLQDEGVKITKSYLCNICSGKKPPASDKVNKAIAKVLSPVSTISYQELRLASYRDKIPHDVIIALANEIKKEEKVVLNA